jgi:Ca2+-binding EF-hand superfamily protein
MPPDLLQYLKDSFEEYDINSDKGLDVNEFWKLMHAMNLGLRDSDEEDIHVRETHSQAGSLRLTVTVLLK